MINVIPNDDNTHPSKGPWGDIDVLIDETKTETEKLIKMVQKIEWTSGTETNGWIWSNMDGQVIYNTEFSSPGVEITYGAKKSWLHVSVLIMFWKPGWIIVNDGVNRVQLSIYPNHHTVTESSGGGNPPVSLERFKCVREWAIAKISKAIEEISS